MDTMLICILFVSLWLIELMPSSKSELIHDFMEVVYMHTKKVVIGENCLIAANCHIIDGNGHHSSFDNVKNRIHTTGEVKEVVIEEGNQSPIAFITKK